jgi:hypothetical protein
VQSGRSRQRPLPRCLDHPAFEPTFVRRYPGCCDPPPPRNSNANRTNRPLSWAAGRFLPPPPWPLPALALRVHLADHLVYVRAAPASKPDREVIAGTVERVTFHNAEPASVLRVTAFDRGVQPAATACRPGQGRFVPPRSRWIFRIHRAIVLANMTARPGISDHDPAR